MKLVDLVGLHIEATSGAPLVLLREHDAPHRVLPIFVGGPEAAAIAVGLSGQRSPSPLAHDVMAALIDTLEAHVDAVEVTDLRDGAFLAELAVTGPAGGRRPETRPSDAIALAVRLGAPLFVSDFVLDEAGTVLTEGFDEAAIDEAVAEFRRALEEPDASDFETGSTGDLPAVGTGLSDDDTAGDTSRRRARRLIRAASERSGRTAPTAGIGVSAGVAVGNREHRARTVGEHREAALIDDTC